LLAAEFEARKLEPGDQVNLVSGAQYLRTSE